MNEHWSIREAATKVEHRESESDTDTDVLSSLSYLIASDNTMRAE